MATLHITPTGAGKRDGSSVENAATFASLDAMVQKAGPGGTVLLHADLGAYDIKTQVTLKHGGTDGQSVTIKGVDAAGNAMDAQFVGTRAADYSPTAAKGTEVFRLLGGADNLNFENMSFKHVLNAFRVGGDVQNIGLKHMEADNVHRFFENCVSGSAKTATISGLHIEDVDVRGFSNGAIRLQYDSHDIVIKGVRADSKNQGGDSFAVGVHLDGTVHDVLVKDARMLNATDTTQKYWNGDGFATERGTYGIRFEDTYAAGNGDAGYDLKSSDTVLLRAVAEDNKRNFRFWGDDVAVIDSQCIDPHLRGGSGTQAHVWLAAGASVAIEGSLFADNSSKTYAFDLADGSAKLTLSDAEVFLNAAARLSLLGKGASLVNADGSKIIASVYEVGLVSVLKCVAMSVPEPIPTTYSVAGPAAVAVAEGNGTTAVTFTVTRGGDASAAGSVGFSVSGSGTSGADAADFNAGALPSGTVAFAAGETTKIVTIEVQGDKTIEANEAFQFVLNGPSKGTIAAGTTDVTILNDDVATPVFTILDRLHATDLSSAAAQTVVGKPGHESFFVDVAAASGRDAIQDFGHTDVLLTTKALYDGNKDGIITFSAGTTLAVDGKSSKDTITFDGDTEALRYLGQTKDGLSVYAEADVRPLKAVESKLSNDALTGSGSAAKTKAFFFDTALDVNLGTDKIAKFGAGDLMVTTTALATTGGVVKTGASGQFELPGGTGGLDDQYVAGEGGRVSLTNAAGKAVTALEYDGVVTHDGVEYYVYSQVGSAADTHNLLF